MFADIATIFVKAGNGGDGAVTFHREKYVASGGPDGGDGGKGGDVILEVDDNLSTLSDFRYKRKYFAENGQKGSGGRCYGKWAPNLTIKVPRGTVVYDNATNRLIVDMSDKDSFVLAKGGKGGFGNIHFATSTRQTPRFAKAGAPGEELEVRLELKLLADVGLIGFPNVGKSTLISVVSQAKPKIANYHFTTLTPVLGVVRMGEESSFVMADIPGLIEGAGEGIGLCHEFLRHVDRCRLLVHVIDASGSEGRDPIEDFEKINQELAVFDEELAKRPQIVAANKCDLTDDEHVAELKAYFDEKGIPFFAIMAPISEGTGELINFVAEQLAKLPPIKVYESEPEPEVDYSKKTDRDFSVRVEEGVYIVEAPWLIKVMETINPEEYDSLQYFERVLRMSGILAALQKAGIQEGDTVSIYDVEFDYVP